MKLMSHFYRYLICTIVITSLTIWNLNAKTSTNQAEPMQYLASDCSQPIVSPIYPLTSDNPILRLCVKTEHSLNAINFSGLTMNMLGTNHIEDVLIIRTFYTGNDSTFSSNKRFGPSYILPSAGNFKIAGNQVLAEGNNYFWITYTLASKALIDRVFDAQCISFTLNDSVEIVPLNPSPIGDRSLSVKVKLKSLGEDVISTKAPYPGTNVASFAQSVIKTYKGYQYAIYWHETKQVAIARKKITANKWETIILDDYTSTNDLSDNHYNLSMGFCPSDGTIHLSFDQHAHNLKYRRSVKNLINEPEMFEWSTTHFEKTRSYLNGTTTVSQVTYPRFITKPDGNLLLEMRRGTSGRGDSFLWEYIGKSSSWVSIGKYIDGISVGQNAYIHGIEFDKNGRLHASWCWRETSAPETNHDLYYAYSDDNGRNWYNSAGIKVGTAGTKPLTLNTSGLQVWKIPKNRSLMNQESMCVDNNGRPHVLNGFIKDEDPNVSVWGTSYPVHFYRDDKGVWQKNFILIEPKTNRDQIVCDANNNIYVILNNNILMATEQNAWKDWTVIAQKGTGSFIGDGAIDKERALNENVLSIATGRTGNTFSQINFLIDNLNPGNGNGLTRELYSDTIFNNKIKTNQENINFVGETHFPEIINKENGFGVRYNGTLETRFAENYSLYITCSGKIRCKINGELVVDDWNNASVKEYKIALSTYASHKYSIEVEGVFTDQSPTMKLEWGSTRHARSIVPLNALYKGIETTPNTGLKNVITAKHIRIYPNPTTGSLNIRSLLNSNSISQLNVYSPDGSKLASETFSEKELNEVSMNYSFLPKGIYFLEIISENLRSIEKLIIK